MTETFTIVAIALYSVLVLILIPAFVTMTVKRNRVREQRNGWKNLYLDARDDVEACQKTIKDLRARNAKLEHQLYHGLAPEVAEAVEDIEEWIEEYDEVTGRTSRSGP